MWSFSLFLLVCCPEDHSGGSVRFVPNPFAQQKWKPWEVVGVGGRGSWRAVDGIMANCRLLVILFLGSTSTILFVSLALCLFRAPACRPPFSPGHGGRVLELHDQFRWSFEGWSLSGCHQIPFASSARLWPFPRAPERSWELCGLAYSF